MARRSELSRTILAANYHDVSVMGRWMERCYGLNRTILSTNLDDVIGHWPLDGVLAANHRDTNRETCCNPFGVTMGILIAGGENAIQRLLIATAFKQWLC